MLEKRPGLYPVVTTLCFAIGCLFVSGSLSASVLLKEGDTAPEFTLPGSDGKQYSLSDFRDKIFVVIAFFPKAFTGG